MLTYGSDRSRMAGGKVILHSSIPKGWTARTAKTPTRGAHPGTAVLWGDQYFEVVSADALQGGGVRYVLEPWRDNEAIRVFDRYDAESEAQRIADYEAALRQQRRSILSRLSGIFLGYLPSVVQNRLADDFGVAPARMTLLSTIPSVFAAIVCIGIAVGASIEHRPSPVPFWVWMLVGYMLVESVVRFQVAMSQNRAMASIPGTIVYALLWLLAPKRMQLVSPFAVERGESSTFTIAPSDDIALRDAVETRGAWLTLLTPAEQQRLAERVGFDYRRHATGLASIMLVFATIGVVSSAIKGAIVPMLVAGLIALEQVMRLLAFRRGPAGSVFGIFVRPFMRDLLQR